MAQMVQPDAVEPTAVAALPAAQGVQMDAPAAE